MSMVNPHDQIYKNLSKAQAILIRQEAATAVAVLSDYEAVLRKLRADFMEVYESLPENPTPGQVRSLANDGRLIQAIDARLKELETGFTATLRRAISDIARRAMLNAQSEVMVIAQALGVPLYSFGIDTMLELIVGAVIDQVPGEINNLRRLLTVELRQGLIAGESFPDLSRRLFQSVPVDGKASVFKRGMNSAELMARRSVIEANNNSKLISLERGAELAPGLQKQVVAHLGTDTTDTCLKAHGQIQNIDQPFELTGEPRFARSIMAPPFHWNCRTSVVAYHPDFEKTSSLTTAQMRQDAQALAKKA